MKKLENILKGGKKLLVGAGLVSLLSVPAIVGCGQEDGNGGGGSYTPSGGSTSKSKYYCDCKGEGFFATMEVYADSGSGAESWATTTCREDYPDVGCSCDCGKAGSSSGGNGSSCIPDCDGKECGSDGCGGSCGSCGSDEYCSDGECKPEDDCVHHNKEYKKCYEGDVWWFDECGNDYVIDEQCGSDEKCENAQCVEKTGCASDKYQCNNGKCISKSHVCDGYQDCSKGEDEENCKADCEDECEEDFKCFGNGWKECGNYDADNCLEWGSWNECGADEYCVGGGCFVKEDICTDKCDYAGQLKCAGHDLFGWSIWKCVKSIDSDPCLEWDQYYKSCDSDEKCVDEKCVPK